MPFLMNMTRKRVGLICTPGEPLVFRPSSNDYGLIEYNPDSAIPGSGNLAAIVLTDYPYNYFRDGEYGNQNPTIGPLNANGIGARVTSFFGQSFTFPAGKRWQFYGVSRMPNPASNSPFFFWGGFRVGGWYFNHNTDAGMASVSNEPGAHQGITRNNYFLGNSNDSHFLFGIAGNPSNVWIHRAVNLGIQFGSVPFATQVHNVVAPAEFTGHVSTHGDSAASSHPHFVILWTNYANYDASNLFFTNPWTCLRWKCA